MTENREENSISYRAALYIRLSREDGDKEESDSVGNQKKLLSAYIEGKNDILLMDYYIDDGYTGTNFKRPGFGRMIEDIRSGKINCVIVKDLSRFGRDYIDTGYYVERMFPENGVRFISLIDGIDSEKQAYDLLLPIKNIFNEQYARDISRKIQATMKAKQKAGEFIGAFPCYGYRKDPGNKNRLVIDKEAAEVVRRIFTMFVQGVPKKRIAELLNEEEIPCPSKYKKLCGENYKNANESGDMLWSYSTIRQILRNEMYAGWMVQGKKHQKMRGKQRSVPAENWIRVEGTHEPLIEEELWRKAQQLLGGRRTMTKKAYENPFSGIVKCGSCKKSMILNRWKRADGTIAAVYYCGTYKRKGRECCTPHALPAAVLESVVQRDIRAVIDSADVFAHKVIAAAQKKEERSCAAKELCRTEQRLAQIKKRRLDLYEDYKTGILSEEEFIYYRKEYKKRAEFYVTHIAGLKKELEDENRKKDMKTAELGEQMERMKFQKPDRSLLVELIDRIEVHENEGIEIYYRFADCDKIIFQKTYP